MHHFTSATTGAKMKPVLLLLLFFTLLGCQPEEESATPCQVIDIGALGSQCDALRAEGAHSKAAQLYYRAGEQNRSSELFVYAAWQFGEAGQTDSALIAVQRAADFGMNSPYVLDKLGLEQASRNSPYRQEVDQLLAGIKAKNESIANFEIITTPVNRFWSYYDQAAQDTAQAQEYLSAYICEGSEAVRDYYHIRYENVANMRRTMLLQSPEYYSYVKNHISAGMLQQVSDEARAMMLRFSEIYPRAIFPKTYLVPGILNSSGTLTELGLFVSVEMFAKSDTMPQQGLSDWQRNTISEFGNMKFDLVHELMHFQQSYGTAKNQGIVMGEIIREGVCDFLVSLLTEQQEVSPGVQRNLDYFSIPANRDFVLAELKRDLYGQDHSRWLHNGGKITDRPSNLGYTMGFLICKSYYERSADKEQAIYELLNTDDFKKIYEGSAFQELL